MAAFRQILSGNATGNGCTSFALIECSFEFTPPFFCGIGCNVPQLSSLHDKALIEITKVHVDSNGLVRGFE